LIFDLNGALAPVNPDIFALGFRMRIRNILMALFSQCSMNYLLPVDIPVEIGSGTGKHY
jgi:hypothetical protein